MWYFLVIPTVTILVLLLFFRNRTIWWEYFVPFIASIISIALLNKTCDYALASDEEYHGGWVISTVWDEHWTEKYTTTSTDKKGRTHTITHYRYHPDKYKVVDSNGYEIDTDSNDFSRLKNLFGNQKSEKPWHLGQSSWGDGYRYTSDWPGSQHTYVPCLSSHRYENRVARSHSIFNFREVDPKKYHLYKYPEIENYYNQKSILGFNDSEAESFLTKFNCAYGGIKKVRVFILVFCNEPVDAGIEQQMYWKNGNKNEVVICIGIDSSRSEIKWVYPFAWDNEYLKIDLRENISELKLLDMKKVVDITTNLVLNKFKMKNFKEFEYLTLDPPLWIIVLCLFFNLALNFGILYWVIFNNYS